jgi:aspartokinase
VRLGGNRGNLEDLRKGPAKSAEVRRRQATERASKVFRQIDAITAAGQGTSLRHIAKALNARGITAPRGGMWHAAQVKAVLQRGADAARFS